MSTVTLATPKLSTPTIVGDTLSIDVDTLPMVFLADSSTKAIEVSIQETGVSTTFSTFSAVGSQNQFALSVDLPAALGTYHLIFRAKDTLDSSPSRISPNYILDVIRGTNENVPQALPPAGIRVLRMADSVKIEWQTPQDEGFLGVRVSTSVDATGVTTPFVQTGDLVQGITRRAQDVLVSNTSVAMNGSTRITTLSEEMTVVPYSSIEFQKTDSSADVFYATLTTLIQDPDTHHVHESYAAGPFACSYVDLRKVTLTDFPGASTPEDNAVSLIKGVTALYPKLDLGPRTEPRDLLVDPIALECAQESTRAWYTRVAQSVSSLNAVDDADGDGISDDPATSAYKLSLARAFRLTADQIQAVIDAQFNVLGERAGVTRGGEEPAIVDVLFYLTSRPTRRFPISEAGVVATLPDDDTASLTFRIMASASLDAASADSFYLPEQGWWGVMLPCVCMTNGSIGNVGAGTIRTIITGADSALQCTNFSKADFGSDTESNSSYAARIADRTVVGVDTGRRKGYLATAQAGTGVVKAAVVASGDLEMLRDWDPIRQKHLFGTVDIYARGRTMSQSSQMVPYTHPTYQGSYRSSSSYTVMTLVDASALRLQFDKLPAYPVAAIVELLADRGSALSFYFGVDRAQYDATTGNLMLHPDDLTYTLNSAGEKVLGSKNSALISSSTNGAVLRAMVRLWGPLTLVPAQQPVTNVYSVTGDDGHTGVIPTSAIRLIRTSDPLLEGDSTRASDRVTVDNSTSLTTVAVTFERQGPDTFDLGEGVALTVTPNGKPQDVVSVLSADSHTRYLYDVAYSLIPLDCYAHYGIKRLPGDPTVPGGQIPVDEAIQVSYNTYRFLEHLTLQTDVLTLQGSSFVPLTHPGFVPNVWIPGTHGLKGLVGDADLLAAKVPEIDRWIKVTYQNSMGVTAVAKQGRDYVLNFDSDTGAVRIARFASDGAITSGISDGGAVTVTYYTAETFEVVTGFPQFLAQIEEDIEDSRHGGADVLVKTMHESLVDMNLTVVLAADASADVLDKKIRTVITAAFDASTSLLSQAEVVSQIKPLPGVSNVRLPFSHMAKADGAYDIGMIIPTGTKWDPIETLQAADALWAYDALGKPRVFSPRTFVTHAPVLRYKTIPSGGLPDAYVGLLYEGEAYQRCLTIQEFQAATSAAFYIVGINEHLGDLPVDSGHYGKVLMVTPAKTTYRPTVLATPGLQAYRVTYQVYGEAGAQDIPISPTEYLRPGKITIDYIQEEGA